jgi:hypothetical protein
MRSTRALPVCSLLVSAFAVDLFQKRLLLAIFLHQHLPLGYGLLDGLAYGKEAVEIIQHEIEQEAALFETDELVVYDTLGEII